MQLNTWKLWHLFRNSILIYLEVYLQILKVFISFGTNSMTFFLKSSYLFTLSASFPSPTNDKERMYFKEIRKTIYMDWKIYINQTQCMYLDLNKCIFTNDRRHFSLTIDNAAEGMRQDVSRRCWRAVPPGQGSVWTCQDFTPHCLHTIHIF